MIQRSLTPVWEANHVWLIFILVVLWTAFPEAFGAMMSTLYVPLALAALGIVLRGAGFAFRKSIDSLRCTPGDGRRLRALLGADAVLHGTGGRRDRRRQRPRRTATATRSRAGWQPLPLLTGGAVRRQRRLPGGGLPDRRRAPRRRGRAGGVLRAAGAGRGGRRRGPSRWPASSPCTPKPATSTTGSSPRACRWSIVSGLCGLGALACCCAAASGRGLRPLAVGAVVAVIWGWGVAQFPYLLPTSLTIDAGGRARRRP